MYKSTIETINDKKKLITSDYKLAEIYKCGKSYILDVFKIDKIIVPDEILKYLKKKKIPNIPKISALDDHGIFYKKEDLKPLLNFFSGIVLSDYDIDETYREAMDDLSRYPNEYFMRPGKEPSDSEVTSIYGDTKKAYFTITYLGNEQEEFFKFIESLSSKE